MFQEAAARWMLSHRGFEGHAPTGGGLRSETLSDVEVLSTRDPSHPLWSPAAPGWLKSSSESTLLLFTGAERRLTLT